MTPTDCNDARPLEQTLINQALQRDSDIYSAEELWTLEIQDHGLCDTRVLELGEVVKTVQALSIEGQPEIFMDVTDDDPLGRSGYANSTSVHFNPHTVNIPIIFHEVAHWIVDQVNQYRTIYESGHGLKFTLAMVELVRGNLGIECAEHLVDHYSAVIPDWELQALRDVLSR